MFTVPSLTPPFNTVSFMDSPQDLQDMQDSPSYVSSLMNDGPDTALYGAKIPFVSIVFHGDWSVEDMNTALFKAARENEERNRKYWDDLQKERGEERGREEQQREDEEALRLKRDLRTEMVFDLS